jgi:hypothetical protein
MTTGGPAGRAWAWVGTSKRHSNEIREARIIDAPGKCRNNGLEVCVGQSPAPRTGSAAATSQGSNNSKQLSLLVFYRFNRSGILLGLLETL